MSESSAIGHVRSLQAALCRDFLLQDLYRHLDHPAVADAAELITQQYFPRAVERENTDNIEMLSDLYRHALVLGPLLYRIPGDSRLDWHVGTELSWFRRCITVRTQQWYWTTAQLPLAPDPAMFVKSAFNVMKIRDADFLKSCAHSICNLAASGGRKSRAAERFSMPVLGAEFDAKVCEDFHAQSNGAMRRKYRAQGAPVGSYLRKGRAAFLLVDGPTQKRIQAPSRGAWTDIREQGLEFGDYRIEWDHKKQNLRVRVQPKVINSALKEVKLALDSHANPKRKFDAVVAIASSFLRQHQYATDSLKELREWNQSVAKLVRKSVTSAMPSLNYDEKKFRVYSKLVLPIGNPFRRSPKGFVSDHTWMSLWSPYL